MVYLVTGGSGFIGSHLVENLLKQGHFVINIDNFDDFYPHTIKVQNTLESLGLSTEFSFSDKKTDLDKLQSKISVKEHTYKLYIEDIRNKDAITSIFKENSIDMVIHLAALAGVRPSIERPLDYTQVNIAGTMNLWEACRNFGVKKFVCASSSSVYGNNDKVPFSETDAVDHPISPYAATKRCGEILGHTYHHLYQIDMIHLRFFTVYGPRQRPDLAIHKFCQLISENQSIPFYGDGTTARDYTYIEDIIQGILNSIHFLYKNKNIYQIINLGESEVIPLSKMVNSLEEAMQRKVNLTPLPMQPGDVQMTNADISLARQVLGYRPSTSFSLGIKKFVEWFLSRKR